MSRLKQPFLQRVMNAVLLILFLPFVLPLALVAIILFLLYRITLYLLVWALWLPRGKDILFVYSDSPISHEYMATEVLPLVQERAVVLNWSERTTWHKWSLGVAVFRHFGGDREYSPSRCVVSSSPSSESISLLASFQRLEAGSQRTCREALPRLANRPVIPSRPGAAADDPLS